MLPILNTDSPTMHYIENSRLSDTITDTDPIYWDDEHLNTWQFSVEKKSICDDIDRSTGNHYMDHHHDGHDSMVASFSDDVDQASSTLEQVCSPIQSPLNDESGHCASEFSNNSSSKNTQDYLTSRSGDYDLVSPSLYSAPLHLECEGKIAPTASFKLEMGTSTSSMDVVASSAINESSKYLHYPIIRGTHYDADENVITRPAETGVFRMNQNQCSTLPSSNLEQITPMHMKEGNMDRTIQNQETSPSSGSIRWKPGHHQKRKRDEDDDIYAGEEDTGCRCTKTKCLKLYCDCFRRGRICRLVCECIDCKNTEEESGPFGARTQIIQDILKRRPDAFQKRIKRPDATCACKNSRCLKKYCLCFAQGRDCLETCACQNCHNHSGMRQAHIAAKAEELRIREAMTAKKASTWKHHSEPSNLFNGLIQEPNWVINHQKNEPNIAKHASISTRVPERGTMRAEV